MEPGLIVFYDIQPQTASGLFFQHQTARGKLSSRKWWTDLYWRRQKSCHSPDYWQIF